MLIAEVSAIERSRSVSDLALGLIRRPIRFLPMPLDSEPDTNEKRFWVFFYIFAISYAD